MLDVCPAAAPFPLSRPALLARSAQAAARRYRRERDLGTALPKLAAEPPRRLLARLAAAEARCEADRRAGAADYRPSRHVLVLAALLAEAAAG